MQLSNLLAITYYDDFYLPDAAQTVIDVVSEYDDETLAVAIAVTAYNAEVELSRN